MDEILNSLIGHIFNTEGDMDETVTVSNWYYPYQGQCVSLIKAFFKKLYGIPLNFGNAIDYYNNMTTNGILKYCDWITTNPQNGDIAVTHCVIDGVDYGHVMIYYNGDYISQNVDSEPHAYIYPNYWRSQIIGWFRPKQVQKDPKFVKYCAHVQNVGWSDWVQDGTSCGTVGKSLRLEAFKLQRVDGGIIEQVKLHIQNKGWIVYDNPSEDEVFGTEGKSLRIENICIKASGLKFKVHIQDVGWTQWTDCDGVSTLGSSGQSLRIEAIRIEKK